MKGNEALAEAAIRAGCRHYFGYPITPQTEIAAYMAKRMPKVGGTFLQAESEVAAINMVLGAAAAGVRAMTSSSSPGISLKSEGISYIAACDLPCLIVDVMRGGPGLGGIQPSQADYWQGTRGLGHGDKQLLVFAPSTVQEMVDTVFNAYHKADTYRIPAVILADGMLGQMMEPVSFPDEDKAEAIEKPWATNGHKGKRTHNIVNSLLLKPEQLEQTVFERAKRYEQVKQNEQLWEEYRMEDATLAVVAYGASARIAMNAIDAARESGLQVGLIRPISLWPFPEKAIEAATGKGQGFLCVEMSMGQMIEDVRLVVSGRKPVAFYGRTGGIIPTPDEVLCEIKKLMGGER